MTTRLIRLVLIAAAATGGALAQGQSLPSPTRGGLLYSTHCIECHNTQVHWRNLKQARDWESLKLQVRRWQAIARLGWSEADIGEVALHLNQTIYHFAQPVARWRDD